MDSKYSEKIAKAIMDYADKEGIKYQFDKEEGTVSISFRLHSNLGGVDLNFNIGEECYQLCSFVDMKATDDDYTQLSEYFTRVNYELFNGNFCLNLENGNFCYNIYVDITNSILSNEIIDRSIYDTIYAFETYGNGLIKVIMGSATAKEAFEEAQKAADEDDDEEDEEAKEE